LNDISSRITCKNKENRPLIPLTISAQDGLINQYDYFDKQIASINLSTYYVLKKGQFAYNKSYSNGYPYGAIKRLERFDEGALSSLYICFELKNIDSNFMCKYFDSNKWNYEVKLISGEGARNHGLLNLSPLDFFNIKLYVPTNKIEQLKIAKFIELIQEKIDISKAKLEALKKYKEGLENYAYKYVKKHGITFIFKDLFSPNNERNILSLKQYTVGKYGIKEMDEGKYDISKHKVFNPTNLIVGIGIEEIGISESTKGSVSPIYDVFKINNNSYYDSIRLTLKSQLWNKRNFITKKSTRREYEVDKKELLKMKIFACENKIFKNITNSIDLNKKTIELLENKLNSLIDVKNYLLKNMFI
jgi:type I restriction enzyme S subunit